MSACVLQSARFTLKYVESYHEFIFVDVLDFSCWIFDFLRKKQVEFKQEYVPVPAFSD